MKKLFFFILLMSISCHASGLNMDYGGASYWRVVMLRLLRHRINEQARMQDWLRHQINLEAMREQEKQMRRENLKNRMREVRLHMAEKRRKKK
jgi:hypothetical protein